MPCGAGIMYIIFFRCIGCTLEPSVLRGHIAPTEPVEHYMYMLYYTGTYYTHTHETAAHGRTCTHIRSSTRPTHKKKRPGTTHSFETVMRDAEERRKKKRKKKRNSFLDRCVPTGRKIRRHFTEV